MATEKWKQEHVEEMREYRRAYYRRNKEDHYLRNKEQQRKIRTFIKKLKRTLCCSTCGESDFRCLDFHHKNPDRKDIAISQVNKFGWSIEKIKKELAKCIVLCSNCHRRRHICKLCGSFKTKHNQDCRFNFRRLLR